MMLVPNLDGDKAGLFSRVFAGMAPISAKGKALKQSNRPLYNVIKWSINLVIILLLVLVLSAISSGVVGLFKAIA